MCQKLASARVVLDVDGFAVLEDALDVRTINTFLNYAAVHVIDLYLVHSNLICTILLKPCHVSILFSIDVRILCHRSAYVENRRRFFSIDRLVLRKSGSDHRRLRSKALYEIL